VNRKLLAVLAVAFSTTAAHAGTIYIPTITYEHKPSYIGSLFGSKSTYEEEVLDAERSRADCETAIHRWLDGDFSQIVGWRCAPYAMPVAGTANALPQPQYKDGERIPQTRVYNKSTDGYAEEPDPYP
jgi:hypothetical protein